MAEDSQALVPIEEKVVVFYEDELTAVLVETDEGQEIYVPVRPIVENLGLAWSPQLRRINRDPVLSEESISVTVAVTEMGQRGAMTCLPLKFLPSFLSGISVNRLTDPWAVSRLVSYQHGLTACIADSFFVARRSKIRANTSTILKLSEQDDPESLRAAVIELAQALGIPLALPTKDPERQWKVYIAKLDRLYKIGCSRDVLARIEELRRAGGATRLGIELVHCFPADRPYKAERQLHESYADKREVGEWFRLSRTDAQALSAIIGFKDGLFTPEVWQ